MPFASPFHSTCAASSRAAPASPSTTSLRGLALTASARPGRWRWDAGHIGLHVFDRARQQAPLALVEIEKAAEALYNRTLATLEAQAPVMSELIGSEREWLAGLLQIIPGQIPAEIAEVERQRGVVLDRESATYATLADALQRAYSAAVQGRLRALDGQGTSPPVNFLGAAGIDKVTLKPITLKAPRVNPR
jgi:hypothetical protein